MDTIVRGPAILSTCVYAGAFLHAKEALCYSILRNSWRMIRSFLMQKLTGGVDGGVHMTDVTNASRTMLMNLETCQWDEKLKRYVQCVLQRVQ